MWRWGDACPDCAATNSVRKLVDSLTCTNCGLEVQSFIFDDSPEWRIYDDHENQNQSQKIRADATLPDKFATKTIKADWDSLQQLFEYGARNLSNLFAAAKATVSKYMEHHKIKTIKGDEHRKSLMGAALYVCSKQNAVNGATFYLKEIADTLVVPLGKLSKAVTAMQAFEKQKTLTPLESHIKLFVYNSQVIPADQHWEVIKRCFRIAEKIKNMPISFNYQIPKMAATLISITVEVMKMNINAKIIAQETKTSMTTLNKLRNAILGLV